MTNHITMTSSSASGIHSHKQAMGNISIVIAEKDSTEVIKLLIENRVPFSCIHSEMEGNPNFLPVSRTIGGITIEEKKFSNHIISEIQQLHDKIVGDFSYSIPSIEEVTTNLKVSPSKFKNTFKLLFKAPYHQYFMEHKMSQARTLLESGQYSVRQVSDMLGYTTPIKFVIVFKKYQKTTPGKIKVIAKNRRQ